MHPIGIVNAFRRYSTVRWPLSSLIALTLAPSGKPSGKKYGMALLTFTQEPTKQGRSRHVPQTLPTRVGQPPGQVCD